MTRQTLRPTDSTAVDQATDVTDLLEAHASAPGFKLTFDNSTPDRPGVLADVEPVTSTFERPAAASTVKCVPVDGSSDAFTARVDTIDRIAIVNPQPEQYTAQTKTITGEARGIHRLANSNPDTVSLASLLDLLERTGTDREAREHALAALRIIAADRPADCAAAVPPVRVSLREHPYVAPATALRVLRVIGEDSPAEIAPAVDDIRPYLRTDNDHARWEATRCVTAIAEHDPADITSTVEDLVGIITDHDGGQDHAVYALSQITKPTPEAVRPFADTLAVAATNNETSDRTRLNAIAGLGRIVQNTSTTGVSIAEEIADLLDADNHKLRNNAIAFLSDVSNLHTDAVRPYLEDLEPYLTDEDDYARINASCTLARIAEDYPDEITPLTQDFIRLLDDEETIVRTNACWALGYIDATVAKPDLERLAGDDPDEDVRVRAMWAISQIEAD